MMLTQNNNVYSEVFELIKYIDINDLDKIPMDILMAIKENRNKEYKPKIDFENINQSLSKNAIALYIWLYKNYMCNSQNELEEINQILYENERKKSEKFTQLMFNENAEKQFEKINQSEDVKLIEYKESFFRRLIQKIKNRFMK